MPAVERLNDNYEYLYQVERSDFPNVHYRPSLNLPPSIP
jgi:hypothetical protein